MEFRPNLNPSSANYSSAFTIQFPGSENSDTGDSLSTLKPRGHPDLERPGGTAGDSDLEFNYADFSEGGSRAWLAVAGAFLIQYCTWGYMSAFSVYQEYYALQYLRKYTSSEIGWTTGLVIFITLAMGIPVGLLFDKGFFRYLMVTSVLLHPLATFLLSQIPRAGEYYQVFLTNGVLLALSNGLIFVPSLSIISHYFQHRYALAIGIASSGSALGAVIHPIVLIRLSKLPDVGMHNAVRILGGINTLLLLIALAVMRTRFHSLTRPRGPRFGDIVEWVQKPVYTLFLLAGMCTFLGVFFPSIYLQLSALTHDADSNLASYNLPIFNVASVFGHLLPNALASSFGTVNLILFTILTASVIACTVSLAHTSPAIVALAVIWGFFNGAIISLLPAAVGPTAKSPGETGTRLGIFYTAVSVPALFAQPVSRSLLTNRLDWLPASLPAGIAGFIASLLWLIGRAILARQRGTRVI